MDMVIQCPSCEMEIPRTKYGDQDWFFCKSCASMFFSHESLRENWPSIYQAIKSRNQKKAPIAS